MITIKTKLNGVLIIEPEIHLDNRGWFYESWSKRNFCVDIDFVQDNHTYCAQKGTLRGIHFQKSPSAQSKLVRCTSGKVLDVVVDIRLNSPTYCQYIMVEISRDNFKQLFIPKGFAHGFLTLTNNVEIQYKMDSPYAPDSERCIRWNDPMIGIEWGIKNPILSEKDNTAPLLKNIDNNLLMEFE